MQEGDGKKELRARESPRVTVGHGDGHACVLRNSSFIRTWLAVLTQTAIQWRDSMRGLYTDILTSLKYLQEGARTRRDL